MNIAVACGGTGGHIFPGLAVARELKRRGHAIAVWLGARDVEQSSTDDWEGDVVRIRAEGFPSGLSWSSFKTGLRLLGACRESLKTMRAAKPDAVLAMGSYASVGPVLAARLLKVPVILHESNAIPGRAVSFLARHADVVGLTFTAAQRHLHGVQTATVGFPTRDDLDASPLDDPALNADQFTVLVMGGSQGAHSLNEIVSIAVSELHWRGNDVQVIHLAGAEDAPVMEARYKEAGVRCKVFGFLKDMGRAYRSADLVVCRAGAASCVELSICAVPALLVPLPGAPRDHQMANARAMEANGGVDVMAESELTADKVADYIEGCRADPKKLADMRKAHEASRIPDGTARIADLVEKAARGQ